MKIQVHIRHGRQNGYVQAYCPDLIGCSAVAATEEEALRLLHERIQKYFEGERTRPVPPNTRRKEIEV